MTGIYEWKDKIIKFHAEYEAYLAFFYKFLVGFVLFTLINSKIGFMGRLAELPVSLVLALVCCLFPKGVMLFAAAVLVTLHISAVSLEIALVVLLMFVLIFFLYFRFTPKDGMLVAITPILHAAGIPYLLPIATGLLKEAYSVVAVVCGTIVFYLVDGIYQNVTALQTAAGKAAVDPAKLTISVEQLLGNKEMYLTIVVFIIVALVVHFIHKMNMDYAWKVSILVGTVIQIITLMTGYLLFDIQGRWLAMIIGSLVSAVLALGIEFLFMDLDYTRTERVQFEDDEYYYYVKAVPKRNVTITEKSITQFTGFSKNGKKKEKKSAVSKKDIVEELGIDQDEIS